LRRGGTVIAKKKGSENWSSKHRQLRQRGGEGSKKATESKNDPQVQKRKKTKGFTIIKQKGAAKTGSKKKKTESYNSGKKIQSKKKRLKMSLEEKNEKPAG